MKNIDSDLPAENKPLALITLSELCHAGLQNGHDREMLMKQYSPLEGDAGFVSDGEGARYAVYNQDATIAVCDVPADAAPVGGIVEDLATQFKGENNSAAISLCMVEDSPDVKGAVRINAACAGDCDVYMVIVNQDTGASTIQRCFDEYDFPDEFDAMDTACRKFTDHIGGGLDGVTRTQTVDIVLQPYEHMSVFTASDGLWDGHIAINQYQDISTQSTPHDVCTGIMKARILKHVNQALQGGGAAHVAHGLIHGLMDDIRHTALDEDKSYSDNLSVSAVTITGGAPLAQKIMLGSIDGAGHVGPTEAMVQDMRAIAIDRSKGQVFAPALESANTVSAPCAKHLQTSARI